MSIFLGKNVSQFRQFKDFQSIAAMYMEAVAINITVSDKKKDKEMP